MLNINTLHRICKFGVVIAGLGASACWASTKYEEFLSLQLGSTFASSLAIQPSSLEKSLDMSAGQSFSLGYGLQENHWRILLQLNQANADMHLAGDASRAGSLSSTAIIYNVYWVPEFDYGISAIIGGGVGYVKQDIKDLTVVADKATALSDGGWTAKLALGVEYRVCKEASLQLLYENSRTDQVKDTKRADWSIKDVNHSELSLGVLYRF